MKEHRKSIVYRAGRYVTRLLIRQLPEGRVFHNLHHTINVVQGVIKIGRKEGLKPKQIEELVLAAWFHDTGHVETYTGHEAVSMRLAREWLEKQDYPADRIAQVLRCIEVTTMPQQPQTPMENVMCDADLYHLSFQSYDHYQEMLREEWRRELGIDMTDEDWDRANTTFLTQHRYFTAYGQKELECRKVVREEA